jgi:polyvinyl alcohol dehydrogenase (cytochrome)
MSGRRFGERRRSGPLFRGWVVGLLAAVALVVVSQPLASDVPGAGPDWTTYGYDPANTRDQPFEHDISAANASQLALKWVATTSGDVSGTPAVADGAVYFGDFGGTVWKLDANTGAVIWSHSVSDYTGIAGDYARTSPAVDGNVVIFGTNKQPFLIGLDTADGSLLWKTQVNPDPHGTMTGSPQLVGDAVITGVSASGASGPGATFRGDIASVNALTGALNWETFSLPGDGLNHPDTGQYAGATMFSAPAVDVADNLVYGTFGNLYSEPNAVAACNEASPNGFFSESCEQGGSFFDSIVAFDLTTGAPVWSYRIVGDAPWHSVCDADPVAWCLPESDTPVAGLYGESTGFGDGWDVGGSSPNVFSLDGERVVGFGAKSGVYYLFDAKTGALKWNTLVGPGGDQGGFEWGSAYDGSRIYVSLTDQHHIPYQLTENGGLTSQSTTGGSWAALDPATGKILWQTADPQTENLGPPTGTVGVWDLGPATVANGVDYVASMAKSGAEMYALDAATGTILWSYSAGSSVNAGPAIVDGSVYWGSGYSKSAEGSPNDRLFAFSIGGVVDTTAPTTGITLSPESPNGSNDWYTTPVGISVSASDNAGGVGVYQTRCVVDPGTPPASFADLPAGDCSLSSVSGDGVHTVYAASEDRDNNAGSVVSTMFKIDATPPAISAAATASPSPNGWYHGPVTVQFTCSDASSGIPAGACPVDQTLSGIGTAISSMPETVRDAAGNVSAPSNTVTVKIVNPTGLCALTRQEVDGSSRAGARRQGVEKAEADGIADLGCVVLDQIVPSRNPVLQRALGVLYKQLVGVLEHQDWLTSDQADNLDTLVGGLES